MAQINRRSTAYLEVTFLDKDHQEAAPTGATYEIYDLKSGTTIREETEISPIASKVEITLTPDDTDIIDESSQGERRRVVVEAAFGDNDQTVKVFEYTVINVKKAAA